MITCGFWSVLEDMRNYHPITNLFAPSNACFIVCLIINHIQYTRSRTTRINAQCRSIPINIPDFSIDFDWAFRPIVQIWSVLIGRDQHWSLDIGQGSPVIYIIAQILGRKILFFTSPTSGTYSHYSEWWIWWVLLHPTRNKTPICHKLHIWGSVMGFLGPNQVILAWFKFVPRGEVQLTQKLEPLQLTEQWLYYSLCNRIRWKFFLNILSYTHDITPSTWILVWNFWSTKHKNIWDHSTLLLTHHFVIGVHPSKFLLHETRISWLRPHTWHCHALEQAHPYNHTQSLWKGLFSEGPLDNQPPW